MVDIEQLVKFYNSNKNMILYTVLMVIIIFLSVALKKKCVDTCKCIEEM